MISPAPAATRWLVIVATAMGACAEPLASQVSIGTAATRHRDAQLQLKKHLMTIDDILANQAIDEIAMSPDGEAAAVVIERPPTGAAEHYGLVLPPAARRGDIWILPRRGTMRNITRGERDGATFWHPVWSPDGGRLAMLSTRGNTDVHIYVWERGVGTVRRLLDGGVQLDANFDTYQDPLAWAGPTELLCALSPPGEPSIEFFATNTRRRVRLERAWTEAERGIVPTASVLEGGVPNGEPDRPQGSLVLVDAVSGLNRTLLHANVRQIALSPNGRAVAITVEGNNMAFGPDQPPRWDDDWPHAHFYMHRRLAMIRLGTRPVVRWVSGLNDPYTSLGAGGWSKDGTMLTAVAHTTSADSSPLAEFSVDTNGVVQPGHLAGPTSANDSTALLRAVRAWSGRASSPRTGFEVYSTEPSNGTFLWTRDTVAAPPRLRLRLNSHLAYVDDDIGHDTVFHYRAANGMTYAARLILPANYHQGRRYPLIEWVYPGLIQSDTVPRSSKPHDIPALIDLHLWATHGYAVLMPSIGPSEGNPVVDMSGFVLAPIDTLVSAGIVDSARVGLAGHSHGGAAVYALLTTTTRFQAAVALSGWADFMSYYGAFNANYCYCAGDFSNEWAASGPTQFESSRYFAKMSGLHIGSTPWVDPARWAANNPIEHFDRVTTPLMIVHGDNDFFYISDADIAFSSLNRLGKRVHYVRYWGEGHLIQSPANLRDLWTRMAGWFDGYLHPHS
jgi:hypothetical protein